MASPYRVLPIGYSLLALAIDPSSGYFSEPRKHMCSVKCATPARSGGSAEAPAITARAAAALPKLHGEIGGGGGAPQGNRQDNIIPL